MLAKTNILSAIVAVWMVCWAVPGAAREHSKDSKEAERASHAAKVMNELMNTPESNIPDQLMKHAHAVAVVPDIVKGAFGVGGTFGKGIVARRLANNTWGAPSFIDLSGGSFGLQLGVSITDLVLVFTREDGLEGLFKDKLEIGGEAGATAGPVGREAEVGTNLRFDSPIYSYSRSKGLFAGIALKGAVMTIDDSANHKVYGQGVTGRDILLEGKVKPVPEVTPFLAALRRASVEAKANLKKETHVASTEHKTTEPAVASTKADIRRAQEVLHEKGLYNGPIDGIIGPLTRKAIREYQKAESLTVNGELDAQTASKLGVSPVSVGENR
jgi:lipid-binding SYLF domain-containing protein